MSEVKTESWFLSQDTRNWLVDLLNQAIRKYSRRDLSLFEYKKERRFYFPPRGTRENIFQWNPGPRLFERTVAKAVQRTDESVNFWVHHAAKLNFIFVGDTLCLKIEPGFVFTENGRKPIMSSRIGPLTTKWMKREYNAVYLNHIRFWASYLSKHSDKISIGTGKQSIEISTTPINAAIGAGIRDDVKNIDQMFELMPGEFEDAMGE